MTFSYFGLVKVLIPKEGWNILNFKPAKFQAFLSRWSVLWILREHWKNKLLGFITHIFEMIEVRIFSRNFMNKSHYLFVLKWLLSAQHHVKYSSSWPNIHFFIVDLLSKYLGRWKCNCSCFSHQSYRRCFLFRRHVKVKNAHVVVGRHK